MKKSIVRYLCLLSFVLKRQVLFYRYIFYTFFKNALMVSLAINIGEIIFQGKKVQETQAIQMKKVKSHLIVKSRTPRNLLESRNQLKIQTFKITMAHLTQISLKLKLRKAMNTVLNKMYLNPMC